MLVINSNADVIHVLQQALAEEGLDSASAHVVDLKREPQLIGELVQRTRPRCIVFDIAPLYDDNWRWFREHFCTHPDVVDVPIVVTTTNLAALRSYGVEAPVIELVGKPFDLNRILEAVEHGLAAYSGSSPSPTGSPA